jgi:hypothetical protein
VPDLDEKKAALVEADGKLRRWKRAVEEDEDGDVRQKNMKKYEQRLGRLRREIREAESTVKRYPAIDEAEALRLLRHARSVFIGVATRERADDRGGDPSRNAQTVKAAVLLEKITGKIVVELAPASKGRGRA